MNAYLAGTPTLTTERLILRAPRMTDYPLWEAFFVSERSRHIGARPDPTRGAAWRAFAHIAGMWALKGWGSFVFCEKDSDKPLGSAGPWTPEDWPEDEIGWTVWSPSAEGRGYAFEAARASRDYAYGTLGWNTAVSYIRRDNSRSIALAERMGCRLDPDAPLPRGDDSTTLVYRHPDP